MSDHLVEASMYITKATHDGKVMRWAATNSDTDPDLYTERMSLELYQNFIDNIKNDTPVPEIFRASVCSEFWDGGMPYVSISHYPDLNGEAVPGEPIQLYVEGNKLKAKGILYDNPLGHAVWRSLKEDKNKTSDKIRISIGFLDLAHKHGENGSLFVREGLHSVCPDCQNKVGNKIYVKGYLVHLALTRVPVNQRTEMVLEEKSMTTKAKTTRKEDAKSIIGDLAEDLDAKSKVERSEALVEMSESDVPDTSPDVEETPVAPVEEPAVEVTEVKSDAEAVEKMDAANLPYGGAVSMKEAQKIQKSKEEMWAVMDMFSVFQNVVWNIVDRNDVLDKKAAVEKAIGEFQSLLAAKAMVEFGMVERSVSTHPLQVTIDALLSSVDNSLTLKTDINEKLASVNPALQELGTAITDYVGQSVGDEPAPAQNDDVVETIKNLIQPLVDTVSAMRGEMEVLKAKGAVEAVTPSNRIPAPRTHTLPPSLLQKSEPAVKPGSLRSIINKSVGLSE